MDTSMEKQNATCSNNEIDMDKNILESQNSTVTFLEFCKLYRHEQILKEFNFIKNNPIDGIYVFPSLKSIQVWYGIVFVKTGLFAEGIFHFKVILNDDYPYSNPAVRFTSKVFHPQVTSNGFLSIINSTPSKKNGQIWNTLRYTRDCFHNINQNAVCNEEVLRIMKANAKEFKALTRGCVLESLFDLDERSTNLPQLELETDNPFNSRLLSPQICTALKKDIVSIGQNSEDFEREESLIRWTKTTMGKMWNDISHYSINVLHSPGSHSSGSANSSPEGAPEGKSPFKKSTNENGHSHL